MMFKRLGLVPTVFALVFIIKTANGHFEDPDFYWHVKTGEYILSSGSLPNTDIFSYTQSGKPWVLHEWLFQVLVYLVFANASWLGVNLLVASLYTACCYVMFLAVKRLLDGKEGKALIITLLCGSLFTGVAPRPYLFTLLFFALFLYRLIVFKYAKDASHLWLFPLVMPFWTNLHGGYFIGIFLLCLFLAAEWFGGLLNAQSKASERQDLMRLAGVTALAVLATLINPEFIHHWWYPFQVIGMDASKGIIEEWRSPDFHQPVFLYFLVVVTGVVGIALYSGRRLELTEFVIPATFVASAFIARRNMPFAAIAIAPFLALQLKAAAAQLEKSVTQPGVAPSSVVRLMQRLVGSTVRAPEISPRVESFLNAWLIVLTLIVVAVQYPGRQKGMNETLKTIIPVQATDFVARNHIQGRMFNAYHYGGYLIYRLFPAQKVFIDGRADMFGDAFVKYAIGAYQGNSIWKQAFEKYQIDYVICETESPIRQLLLEGGGFKLVFDDRMHSVLLKNVDKYQYLIRKYQGRPAHD
jgi:hypothetical protein